MSDKKIYFAVKGLLINQNKMLILHKTNADINTWELPGGRMEFGECAEETLSREVWEECGLAVTPRRLLDTWNYVAQNYHITGIIYLCESNNSEVLLSEEHNEYKWVDIKEEVINNMHDVFKVRMLNWNWDEIKIK